MSIMTAVRNATLGRKPKPETSLAVLPPSPTLTPRPLNITDSALEALRATKTNTRSPFVGIPEAPPGVRGTPTPKGMAMDDAISCAPGGEWGAWAQQGVWGEGLFFPGYPYLAELMQRAEYRNIIGTIAEEMTRKWIKLKATSTTKGGADKTDKIRRIDAAMKNFALRDVFNRAVELDGGFGMGMIYIDTGFSDNPEELASPLVMDKGKIGKGDLKGFVVIDPTWVSPDSYNSINPLLDDFMVPSTWWIMGKRVHASRLLIIRSREVPDILKPAYNFGGLSLSQMAKPYVDNWLRTRQSVSDLLHSFTVFVLKTVLNSYLADATQLMKRLAAFVLGRDNKGLMMVDKETEELENVSAPIAGLDKLQAQAQEQMASVTKEPLVKAFGMTPSGLNSTSDGEIRVWYDHVHAEQEKTLGAQVTTALQVIQLSELGVIDPEIEFEFVQLWELDAAGQAAVEKQKADTDAVYIENSVISNEEVRTRLAGDPESPYHGLEGPAPEIPEPADGDTDDDDANKIGSQGAQGGESGANSGV